MTMLKDNKGNQVTVGTSVRLLSLSEDWLNQLPLDERCDLRSMIGHIFEVVEIDQNGCAWIDKSWNVRGEDSSHSHSMGLKAHEMEVVGGTVG